MDEQITRQGIDRRFFLKGAAVAGATVWAAPTIQSFMSPAVAASVPCAYFVRFKVDVDSTTGALTLDSGAGSTDCLPDGYADARPFESFDFVGSGENWWSYSIDGTTFTLTITFPTPGDYRTAVVTIQGGDARDIDIDLKAGAKDNLECGGTTAYGTADPTYTVEVSLSSRDISYIAGTMCIVDKAPVVS